MYIGSFKLWRDTIPGHRHMREMPAWLTSDPREVQHPHNFRPGISQHLVLRVNISRIEMAMANQHRTCRSFRLGGINEMHPDLDR